MADQSLHILTAAPGACTDPDEDDHVHFWSCFEFSITCPGVSRQCTEFDTCRACTPSDVAAMNERYDDGAGELEPEAHGVTHSFSYDDGEFRVPNGRCWAVEYPELTDAASYLIIREPGDYPVTLTCIDGGLLELTLVTTPEES